MSSNEIIVLAENEELAGKFAWNDQTGVRYHFPNQYNGRIKTGKTFIYYRGVRRKNGVRGTPEYFGIGKIGQIFRDSKVPETEPKSRWQWYCSIEEYTPFKNPVQFERPDGTRYEEIKSQNLWGVAVRSLSKEAFEEVIGLSGIKKIIESDKLDSENVYPEIESFLDVAEIGLLIPKKNREITSEVKASNSKPRYSKISKIIGDRAEKAAIKYIRDTVLTPELLHTLKWVAQDGLKPGWDIEYFNSENELIAVEVKGTTASSFSCIELTANEWKMAEKHRENYWVYLIANCGQATPRISKIQDPFGLFKVGKMSAQPSLWRLDLLDGDN